MLMHLLVLKSGKNNCLTGELESSLASAPNIFFQWALKVAQKGEEKDKFDVVIDGLLYSAIEGADEGVPEDKRFSRNCQI